MKRVVKLKAELILSIIISTIIGLLIATLVTSIYREVSLKDDKLNAIAHEKNNEEIGKIENFLDIESKNENVVYENMKLIEKNSNSYYSPKIFIVDNNGLVKLTTSNLGIKQIDLTSGEGSTLIIDEEKFTSINITKLNDESFIVYLNESYIYDDIMMTQVWIISALIIFIILISGRVKYISQITENVKGIATGNLANRVPLKYKNELTNLAEDINYMVGELQEQELSQKEFITNISHDLRTPLTAILGYSKMIEEKVYLNEEELQKYVSVIRKKGDYLKIMLDDFFDYSKLASKDKELEKVMINLNEITMQLLDEEGINFKENKLNLCVEIKNKKLNTYGDPMLIARALDNLISNSLKYSKKNTDIKVSLNEDIINGVNYGVFSISNIPKNNIDNKEINNLFKRLYKIDKGRKEDGSGLGLAITQEIIKAHNGFVDVRHSENRIEFIIGLII